MRWLLVFVVACLVFNALRDWLDRRGWRQLPGDFRLRLFGRAFYVPLGSSIALTVLGMLIGLVI